MKRTSKEQLIGKAATIVKANNKSNVGFAGKIVDETKYTITLLTKKGEKKFVKSQIALETGEKIIQGEELVGRIEERLKK